MISLRVGSAIDQLASIAKIDLTLTIVRQRFIRVRDRLFGDGGIHNVACELIFLDLLLVEWHVVQASSRLKPIELRVIQSVGLDSIIQLLLELHGYNVHLVATELLQGIVRT